NRGLHLHGLNRGDGSTSGHSVALSNCEGHNASERRSNMARVGRVSLLCRLDINIDRAVANKNGAKLAVHRRHARAHALVVGIADGLKPHINADALLHLDNMLFALTQAVKVVDSVDDGEVAVVLADLGELRRWGWKEKAIERISALSGGCIERGLVV